jgi:hypothetical protein
MSDTDRYFLTQSEIGRLRSEIENTKHRYVNARYNSDFDAENAASLDLMRLRSELIQREYENDQWQQYFQGQQHQQSQQPQSIEQS